MMVMMNGEEKVIEEVNRGRELAMQLQRLLLNDDGDDDGDDGDLKEQLAGKIQESFWNSLSILKNISHHSDHHYYHQQQPSSRSRSSSSSTTSVLPKAAEEATGKGRYKRSRKCSDSDIRKIKHSTIHYDDGHAWRKYGQKIIHNTEFPRCYYRCTHKYDQGCKATKHIEMIQQNPAKYQSTYYGYHTCTSPENHAQFLMESAHHEQPKGTMLSFESPISSTFKSPQSTSMILSSTVQVEDHLMMNSMGDSNSFKDDDEQAAVISQQPADSPEYQLPFGFDFDGNNFIDMDFTDLYDFIFN